MRVLGVGCVLTVTCRFEAQLVDEVQTKLLRVFRPLARLPVEHEVGLQDKLSGLKQKLQESKVSCLGLACCCTHIRWQLSPLASSSNVM